MAESQFFATLTTKAEWPIKVFKDMFFAWCILKEKQVNCHMNVYRRP